MPCGKCPNLIWMQSIMLHLVMTHMTMPVPSTWHIPGHWQPYDSWHEKSESGQEQLHAIVELPCILKSFLLIAHSFNATQLHIDKHLWVSKISQVHCFEFPAVVAWAWRLWPNPEREGWDYGGKAWKGLEEIKCRISCWSTSRCCGCRVELWRLLESSIVHTIV